MTALAGRSCVITGASRGLGAQVARTCWEAGAHVFLVARSAAGLAAVVEGLPRRSQQRAVTREIDLSDQESPEQIIAMALAEFGAIDVLVNNAAMQGPIGPAWDNEWAEWQATIQLNLLVPVALCRAYVQRRDHQRRGKIITLSGGGATSPRAHFSAYSTAKAGLVRFSEILAEETRDLGIDVNCVAPGTMDTAMLEAVREAGPTLAGQREYDLAMRAHQGGLTTLERAAALCVFLASAASDGITGKLISAVWDPWQTLPSHREELRQSDIYTLRRVVPQDRGLRWE